MRRSNILGDPEGAVGRRGHQLRKCDVPSRINPSSRRRDADRANIGANRTARRKSSVVLCAISPWSESKKGRSSEDGRPIGGRGPDSSSRHQFFCDGKKAAALRCRLIRQVLRLGGFAAAECPDAGNSCGEQGQCEWLGCRSFFHDDIIEPLKSRNVESSQNEDGE